MNKTKGAKSAARRDFLRTAGLGAIAGAAAASVGPRKAEAAVSDDSGKSGYRETAHVRKVYEVFQY